MADRGQGADLLWNDDAFRKRVAQLAADRGLSIAELCRRAGLSASYLAKPSGKSGRSVEALLGIAGALNVSMLELVGAPNLHDATPNDENLARIALVAEIAAYLYVALGARSHIPTGASIVDLVSVILRRLETGDSSAE
jgi:transcriptional regulator with XRE-family HTH domain